MQLGNRPAQAMVRKMISSEVRRTSDQWNPLKIAFDRPHEADFPEALMALSWRDRAKVLRDMWRFVVLYKEFLGQADCQRRAAATDYWRVFDAEVVVAITDHIFGKGRSFTPSALKPGMALLLNSLWVLTRTDSFWPNGRIRPTAATLRGTSKPPLLGQCSRTGPFSWTAAMRQTADIGFFSPTNISLRYENNFTAGTASFHYADLRTDLTPRT